MIMLGEIYDKIHSIISKHYPNLRLDSRGYSGPEFHSLLSPFFKDYVNTPWFYKGKLEFIHWTSLPNLFSIINNGEIRLYNLFNPTDENELKHAAKLLSLPEDIINHIKERYYTASFCSGDELMNKELWKEYGKDYKGVAIKFSLIDNRENWENFFLSYVYYKLPEDWLKFQNEIKQLLNSYDSSLTLDFDIWKFAGFYKEPLYSYEKEIRLSAVTPFNYTPETLKYTRTELRIQGGRNRIVKYLPLELWKDPESTYFKALSINSNYEIPNKLQGSNLPKLKIEGIYFGNHCGLSDEEYYELKNELEDSFNWTLGYNIFMPLSLCKKDDIEFY